MKMSGTIKVEGGITDSQIEDMQDQLKEDDDYTDVSVKRTGDSSASVSANVKKSAISGDDTTYDEAKDYVEDLGYTCKD